MFLFQVKEDGLLPKLFVEIDFGNVTSRKCYSIRQVIFYPFTLNNNFFVHNVFNRQYNDSCVSVLRVLSLDQIFLPFHWPRAHHMTCKELSTNNGLLMRNVVRLCLSANNILLMRKWNNTFLLLAIGLAWKWQMASLLEDIR